MDVNHVILEGILTHEPELRSTQSGSSVTNVRIETKYPFKNRHGEEKIERENHPVTAFGGAAEDLCELHKGERVRVEGRMRTNRFTDKNGIERAKTEIIAHKVLVSVSMLLDEDNDDEE